MRAYIIRRLLLMPFMLLAMSALLFYLLQIQPGDAALLKIGATGSCAECLEAVREDLGLDRPPIVQYFDWLGDILRGDFGETLGTGDSIGKEIADALPVTIELAILTILLTLIIGVPIGVISAVKQGTPLDYFLRVFTVAGLSIPAFWLGTLIVLLPVLWFDWTPLVRDYKTFLEDPIENLRIMFWPALTLAVSSSAYVARLTRSSMLETLYSDFVRTARAKGLRERVVVIRHVLRGSLVTILTLIGIQFGAVLGGSVLIEQIFAIPGMGQISLQAVNKRDYREVMAVTMVFATMFIFITLIIDVLYAYVDPRDQVLAMAEATIATPVPASAVAGYGFWQRQRRAVARFIRTQPLGVLGVVIIIIMVLAAVFADLITSHDPTATSTDILQEPSGDHWFGTTRQGKDVYSRVVYGARVSLQVGVATVLISVVGGTALALLAGYFRGLVDQVISRIADVLIAFPSILFALTLATSLGKGLTTIVISISIIFTPVIMRIMRGAVLQQRDSQYVEAARVLGGSEWRIMMRHLLPNLVGIAIITASATLPAAILTEAGLSFLGVGVDLGEPSWGGDLSGDARQFFEQAWWMAVFPGLALSLTVLAFNLLGDSLRDTLDPRLRGTKAGG